jgi:hypothetical protein
MIVPVIAEIPCFCHAFANTAVNVESRDPSEIRKQGSKCMLTFVLVEKQVRQRQRQRQR